MNVRHIITTFFLSAIFLSLVGCTQKLDEETRKMAIELLPLAKENFQAISDTLIDRKKHADLISLGKRLYLEKNLSINRTISCNSCHKLDHFGVDNEPTSPGHDGRRGGRNSPTTFNAALHIAQFWDGRAKTLEEQALGPILNPIEMGLTSAGQAIQRLKETGGYEEQFKKAFPQDKNPMTFEHVGKAIAAFEKTLLTPSPFDDYLKGNAFALQKQELLGLKSFMEVGCTTCHSGAGIGGGMFMPLGLDTPYPGLKDKGRFEVTKDEEDMFVFKVPGLRNIEKTAPYFHDGSIKTLEDAIRKMAKHQLGRKLQDSQVQEIKSFLSTLTGEVKGL